MSATSTEFKNLVLLKLAHCAIDADKLEAALSSRPLQPCASNDMTSLGWVRPKGKTYPFAHVNQGHFLIAHGAQNKLLPGTVIDIVAKARAEDIESQQGSKVGRRQMKEIKEAVTQELLPNAFVLPSQTNAWIDTVNGWLVVNASSSTKAEEIATALHKLFAPEALSFAIPKTELSPVAAMTDWLSGGEAPAGFTIDRDCELTATGEGKEAIRYVNHNLDGEEIAAHIAAGKRVSKLAMTWNSRISFVLTDTMQIKRISMLDFEGNGCSPHAWG